MSISTALYEEVVNWEKVPEGLVHADVGDVAVDSEDRVYLLARRDTRVCVYDREGNFIKSWGEKSIGIGCHGITVGPDFSVYLADYMDHTVSKFTNDGDLLTVVGTAGVASDTGVDKSLGSPDYFPSIRGGLPFNGPTKVAIAPEGDIYVSDGYGNARIHRFTPDLRLVESWGEAGIGPGQFCNPHNVHISAAGRVYVSSRENERVQEFTLAGEFVKEYQAQRPCAVAVDPVGRICVAELDLPIGSRTLRRAPAIQHVAGRVSVLNASGEVLDRIGKEGPPFAEGVLTAPNGIAVDSHGDIYVAQVVFAMYNRRGPVPPDCPTIYKFRRKG